MPLRLLEPSRTDADYNAVTGTHVGKINVSRFNRRLHKLGDWLEFILSILANKTLGRHEV